MVGHVFRILGTPADRYVFDLFAGDPVHAAIGETSDSESLISHPAGGAFAIGVYETRIWPSVANVRATSSL